MDLSAAIAWGMPLIGIAAASAYGYRRAAKGDKHIGGASLGIAVVLGLILTFGQMFLHTACIEMARLCISRGDVNMDYWFQSFYAIPFYWVSSILASNLPRQNAS